MSFSRMKPRESSNSRFATKRDLLYSGGCLIALLPVLWTVGAMVWIGREFKKHYDREEVAVASLADLERRLRLQFPPGTVLLEGRALFGFAGGNLVARVQMPGKVLPQFLVQPAVLQDPSRMPGTPSATILSEITIAAEVAKAAVGPGKRLTAEQIDDLDVALMMPGEKRYEGNARAWKLDQVRHLYHGKTYESSGHQLKIMVNLDDPAMPVVYLIYYYI